MAKPTLHTDQSGRYYWEHKPHEFNMDRVNGHSFITEFGYCKKYKVLRIKFRKQKTAYQYFFTPFWVYRNMKMFNNSGRVNQIGVLFRESVYNKTTYLQEGSVNQLEMVFEKIFPEGDIGFKTMQDGKL